LRVHELAIVEGLLQRVHEVLGPDQGGGDGDGRGGARVAVVRLEVGRLACVVPEALRFCFDVCCRGTLLEGATLEIAEIPGRARCSGCGAERNIESYVDVGVGICDCGGTDLRVCAGEELRVKNLELI
jgi:hydrogenase nickel incorporation protein HypA/HybF